MASPAPNTSGQKVIAGTLLNIVGQAYSVVLAIVVIPYIIHGVGTDLYGMIAIAASLGGFGSLLNLGLGRAVAKLVSDLYWKGEWGRIVRLFETAWTITVAGGVAAFLALIIPQKLIRDTLFHGAAGTEVYVPMALFLTALGLLFSIATETLTAIPTALQRFDLINSVNIIAATIRQLGSVIALYLGFYVKGVLVANMTSSLFLFVATLLAARRIFPNLSLYPRIEWSQAKRLLIFSSSLFISGVAALVVLRLDRLIVAYYLPLTAVAFYVVPYTLAERVPMGVSNITTVIYPAASELLAMGKLEKARELYFRASKMAALIALPISLLLIFMSSSILRYYVGPEFEAQASFCLKIIAVGFLVNSFCHVPVVFVTAIGRPELWAKYSVANAAANLILFVLLIPRFGMNGAAVGFFIPQAISAAVLLPQVGHIMGLRLREVIKNSFLAPMACGAAIPMASAMLSRYVNSLWSLLGVICLLLAIYGCLAFLFCLDRREKAGIYQHMNLLARARLR
ncbi:MAG TPA: flippase [Candidatus Angelobacter sp.]|nr:flippase [Candidatus Angelobacter sp.]